MELTRREAFKLGFLMRCAEEGLDEAATTRRMKLAAAPALLSALLSGAKGIGGAGLGLVKGLGLIGAPLAVGGAGFGAGMLGAKMLERNVDPAEAKVREIIATYQQQADRIKRNGERRRAELAAASAPRSARLL